MKQLVAILLMVVMAGSLVACEKQPVQQISDTQAAVEVAVNEGSEKYAAEDFRKVKEAMAAAMEEIRIQDSKLFKSYEKANRMLAQVKADAEVLKVKAASERDRLMKQAMTDMAAAQRAYAEARGLLDNVPKAMGSAPEIMALEADVAGVEMALQEMQPMFDAGDYRRVSEAALDIDEAAAALSNEITTATEKLATAAREAAKAVTAKKKKKK